MGKLVSILASFGNSRLRGWVKEMRIVFGWKR